MYEHKQHIQYLYIYHIFIQHIRISKDIKLLPKFSKFLFTIKKQLIKIYLTLKFVCFGYKLKIIAMKRTLTLCTVWASCSCLNLRHPSHDYSMDTSQVISQAIKQTLLANIGLFSNKQFSSQFEKDLKESDDSKRKLTTIDRISAEEMFNILKIQDPGCDANGDYQINGMQLKCLNYIWQAYLPQ